jgi:hypothetical protein
MVRPIRAETARYGEYSKPGEFVYDHPFLWGSRRIGPDLHRVGGKYPHLWHVEHMRDPRRIAPGPRGQGDRGAGRLPAAARHRPAGHRAAGAHRGSGHGREVDVVQEVFARYAWLGEAAVVVAFLGFLALLLQLVLERRSPRWAHVARLPLDDAREVRRER